MAKIIPIPVSKWGESILDTLVECQKEVDELCQVPFYMLRGKALPHRTEREILSYWRLLGKND